MNKLVEYEFIEGISNLLGMSLVDEPAVESNFLTFAKVVPLHFNAEKRIVTGCAIRANYIIPRNGFDIVFRPDVIEKIMIDSMKKGFPTTLQHQKKTDGAFLIESFILRENDERFPDIEVGSWFVSYKITDDDVWNDIVNGKINGFSIEILLNQEMQKNKEEIPFIF